MNDIVKYQPATPATLPEKMQYAKALAASGMLPGQYRQQPANLLYALEYAESLGLHPMAAITGIHVIEGKPSASAALISALVRRAGHKLRVRGDDQEAVAQIVRADDPDWTFEARWTMARAEQAGLAKKKVWREYPAAMLKARAITEVARDACEEALSGMHYTPEELGANVNADGEIVEAEVQQLRRVQQGEQDPWATPPPQPKGTLVVDPECIVTHPEGQAIVDAAAEATHRGEVKERWAEAKDVELLHAIVKAPDTGEWEMVREYLSRLGKALPEAAAATPKASAEDDVQDAEVVAEGETEADLAERDLRAAAEKVGLDNLDEEFEKSFGLPIAQAPAAQMRQMTAILTGSAA
ncbi:hypothetical protein [Streptomyces sp. BK340]|uniref:hypothetical protein n=1 Tax=Streptomyces sp. BK340 TaxID=2572903 RepID=UPI0011A5C8BF|nr:hypothetical protein [Streptomyces sp. BK340]TVZ96461.1 hypothetical protein FB157_103372 [Streptomyces sp. BK340]